MNLTQIFLRGNSQLRFAIVDLIMAIIMAVLSWLLENLWLLIRAALLALIFIALAIEILTLCSIFTAVGAAFDVMGALSGLQAEHEVEWIVEYGKNTRVGFFEMELFDNLLSLAGWIYWTYWSYFDVWIPTPDLDFEMDTVLDEPVEEAEAPRLHCGYLQVGNESSTTFNFYTSTTFNFYTSRNHPNLFLFRPSFSLHAPTTLLAECAVLPHQ
jgi:hypothetical protein